MIKEILIVFTFLTRIPFKISFTYGAEDMGRTSRYFPLVGLVIGFFVALIVYLFNFIDPQLGAVLGILTGIVLTGGLHLDGFMDTADGIFSARTREEMLEIMKDSRVGAHGVTACVILLLLKFVLYGLAVKNFNIFWVFIMAFMFSRWAMAYAILFYPGARNKGLGHIFITYKRKSDFPIASVLTVLPIIIFQNWVTLIPLILSFGVVFLYLRSIQKLLGGLTGDIYGSLAEISEVIFILIYFVIEYFV
ncbi:MAG: adenosylcobinamide-GDP ribazoletransferase [Bacillota bacterium]|jgi:adenosylcobinamide-GDP ribazoletransferase|nr:adenosylcobinamide-GDP ribazoletransferase [Clostridia bacterium]